MVEELLMEKRVEVEVKSSDEEPIAKMPLILERKKCLVLVASPESCDVVLVSAKYGAVEATWNDQFGVEVPIPKFPVARSMFTATTPALELLCRIIWNALVPPLC